METHVCIVKPTEDGFDIDLPTQVCTVGFMKTVPQVYTLLMNTIYVSQGIQIVSLEKA